MEYEYSTEAKSEEAQQQQQASESPTTQPEGWQTVYAESSKRYYAYNTATGESRWLDCDSELYTNEAGEEAEASTDQISNEVQYEGEIEVPRVQSTSEQQQLQSPASTSSTSETFAKMRRIHRRRMRKFWHNHEPSGQTADALNDISAEDHFRNCVTSVPKQRYIIKMNLPTGVSYPEAKTDHRPLASSLLSGASKIYDVRSDRELRESNKLRMKSQKQPQPKHSNKEKIVKKTTHHKASQRKKRVVHGGVRIREAYRKPGLSTPGTETGKHSKQQEVEAELQALSDGAAELFNLLDVSGDGYVSVKEVADGLYSGEGVRRLLSNSGQLHQLTKKPVANKLINATRRERDSSGQISISAFQRLILGLLNPEATEIRQAEFKQLFQLMDQNGDGSLDFNELRHALRTDPRVIRFLKRSTVLQPFLRYSTMKKLDQLFHQHDIDNSSTLSWHEFLNLCNKLN